jgi:manganese transport protein
VWSQVVLCFGIPFALVPLLCLTGRRDLMQGWVNRRVTTAVGAAVTVLIVGLNGYLLVELLG